PVPLVPRDLVFEVPERMSARGEVVEPLDRDAVAGLVDRLAAAGIESIAVCLLHSYANAAHERAVGRLIAERHPGLYVSLSCDVAPEHREYERSSTVVIGAFVRPEIERYLPRFEE